MFNYASVLNRRTVILIGSSNAKCYEQQLHEIHLDVGR